MQNNGKHLIINLFLPPSPQNINSRVCRTRSVSFEEMVLLEEKGINIKKVVSRGNDAVMKKKEIREKLRILKK